jgi:probable O-glycosylation ligase (exosortase A-associated)
MRALLLLLIVGGISAAGVLNARLGIFGYIWFSLMRPDYPAYAAGAYNYSLVLAVGALLGTLRYLGNIPSSWLQNPSVRRLLFLHIAFFAATHSDSARYQMLLRMAIVLLTIPLVITTIEHLKQLYLVTAVALGIWGLWHGMTGVLRGGLRIYGGIGGMMSENNTFAFGLTMVLPFCWYMRSAVDSKWLRMLLLAMTFGSMATIVLTFSRSAALALGVLIVLMTLQSKRSVLTFAAILVLGLVPVLTLVSDAYFDRVSNTNYAADSSSMGRIHLMKAAVHVWRSHPWFGVGLEDRDFTRYSDVYIRQNGYIGEAHVVHNSFLWILAHCGLFGFLAFVYLLARTLFYTFRSARKMEREAPELAIYPRILAQSLIAYLIGSMTHPRATFDFAYMIVMYAAAWWVVSNRLKGRENTYHSVAVSSRPEPRLKVRGATPVLR